MGIGSEGVSSEPGQTNPGAASIPGEAPAPVFIPDHQLLRCIGRGSYGEVWLARNMMGAFRAVKIVYRKSFKDRRPWERELSGIRKFEPISRSHEGFVDVLHVGTDVEQSCFFYVMELGDDAVTGQTIVPETYLPKTLDGEISRGGKLCLQECLQLGLALSQALAELHKHGLVHRDIKPSNLIFVNGVPKLADIGLVAEIAETHSYVGTVGFIPPEGPGTPQADVYSLGKVLYEACTGNDRQEFPELPSWWDQSPEHAGMLELNEIILKACHHDATKRYQSAWDLYADLVVLANGKSVKRLRLLERRWSNVKRATSLTTLGLGLVGAILFEVCRQWKATAEARQREVDANVASGNRSLESGDLLGALPFYSETLALDEGNPKLEWADRLRLGSVLAQCPKLTHFWHASKRANDGTFSPDGKRVLIAEHFGKARIYDLSTGTWLSQPFGSGEGLRSAAYSYDGQFVVTASEDGTAGVWDVQTLKEMYRLPHPDRVASARFNPDGTRVVTACYDGLARVWELKADQTNQVIHTLRHGTNTVLFADFSPDGRLIVTTSYDRTARLWSAMNGTPIGKPLEHDNWVTYAAFSPDGQKLVTASVDRTARVWETATSNRLLPDLNHRDAIKSAEFSPDGRWIVTASFDGAVRFWQADTLRPLATNPVLRQGERVTRATFSPDGHRLLTTCADGAVRVWDLAGSAVPPLVQTNAFSQDGSRFWTLTNSVLQVWDSLSGRPVSPQIQPSLPVQEARLSAEGQFLLTLSAPTTTVNPRVPALETWEVQTGFRIGPPLFLANVTLKNVSISRDGQCLVAFIKNAAQAWNLVTGKVFAPQLIHENNVQAAVFSALGQRVATWSGEVVRVWDWTRGRDVFPPLKLPFPVTDVQFTLDGSRLVTCGADDTLKKCHAQVWDALTGQPLSRPLPHADGVQKAVFSPDGNRVATASEDFSALVWEVRTGKRLVPPLIHENVVLAVDFSPDGQWILTASPDKRARIWSTKTGDPLTPWLHYLGKPDTATFLPDGQQIVITDGADSAWLWKLPVDQRPAKELKNLAYLLSAGADTLRTEPVLSESGALERLWRQLRGQYPDQFIISSEAIAAWHQFQAEESELGRQWFAAAFHLERLLALRPGDQGVMERLTKVRRRLESGKLTSRSEGNGLYE